METLTNQFTNLSVGFHSLTHEKKINLIQQSDDFTESFISSLLCYPEHWDRYKSNLAYRIGQLGDIFLFEAISDIAKNKKDDTILADVLDGACQKKHLHLIQKCLAKGVYMDQSMINNISDDINIVQKLIGFGVDTNKLLYGAGYAGILMSVEHFISCGEADILKGFWGACHGGSLNIVQYYVFNNLISSGYFYKGISMALTNDQDHLVGFFIDTGMDLEPIFTRKVQGFDYGANYDKLIWFISAHDDMIQ